MPATTQETGVKTPKSKTPEAELRRSEHVKQAESDAYALPPPLQVKERQAKATKAAEKSCRKDNCESYSENNSKHSDDRG